MPTPSRPLESFPVTGLVAVTQTALGCGVGLLMAGHLREKVQRTTAIAMFSLGILSTASLAIGLVARAWNRPESERGMERRLDSIRADSGFSDEVEIF